MKKIKSFPYCFLTFCVGRNTKDRGLCFLLLVYAISLSSFQVWQCTYNTGAGEMLQSYLESPWACKTWWSQEFRSSTEGLRSIGLGDFAWWVFVSSSCRAVVGMSFRVGIGDYLEQSGITAPEQSTMKHGAVRKLECTQL